MYNRYIPNGTAYTRIPEEDSAPFRMHAPQGDSSSAQPGPKEGPPPGSGGGPHSGQGQGWPFGFHWPLGGESEAGEKKTTWLSGLLKNFKLDELDTGDILLLLIVLFLFIDGDDTEMLITLGLLILFGLGGKSKEEQTQGA